MTPEELWLQAEHILDEVLERPRHARAEFLEQACGANRQLRREVASLVEVAERAEDGEDPLERPVASLRRAEQQEAAGRRFGAYETQRELGRGGMGVVYLAVRAEDELNKPVAIKVLKRDMDTEGIARRFRLERQVLAQLDHPNIAKLYAGGSAEGLPYFVMEYVEGERLDRYCDGRQLSIRERLEVFVKICSAVQFAHQNLVVHRDLKPGNILVTRVGQPKLLDFGIAKLLQPEGTSSSLPGLTTPGVQPMTVEYASPEQVQGQVVTTATDIYSLGVILYELVTGHHPFRKPNRPLHEIQRAICEDEPLKPSTAVGRAPEASSAGSTPVTALPGALARARRNARRTSRRRLAGDLDAMVLKALRKNPRHRYSSVEQLSEDIRNHLEGRPVQARKPTVAYRVGRFVQRHKLGTAMAAGLLVSILGFGINATILKNRAQRQWQRAEQEWRRAERVTSILTELLEAPDPNRARGEEITVREILDVGRAEIQQYRQQQPRLYASLANTMGVVYQSLGLYPEARSLLDESVRTRRELWELGVDRQLASELAIAINDLAALFYEQGDYRQSEILFREALEIKIGLYGNDGPELVNTLNNLATTRKQRGDYEGARQLYERGLRIRRGQDPAVPADVAYSLSLLGTLLLDRGDTQQAVAVLEQALAIRLELYGSEHTGVATVLNNLGIVREAEGEIEAAESRYREALRIRRKLLGENHASVANTETNLASVLVAGGSYREAELLASHALEVLRESKPGHWRIAHAQSVLGSCLVALGRYPEAEPLLVESYPILEAEDKVCARYNRDALRRLVGLYDAWERGDEAVVHRRRLEACQQLRTPG